MEKETHKKGLVRELCAAHGLRFMQGRFKNNHRYSISYVVPAGQREILCKNLDECELAVAELFRMRQEELSEDRAPVVMDNGLSRIQAFLEALQSSLGAKIQAHARFVAESKTLHGQDCFAQPMAHHAIIAKAKKMADEKHALADQIQRIRKYYEEVNKLAVQVWEHHVGGVISEALLQKIERKFHPSQN